MTQTNGQYSVPAFSKDQELHAYREMLAIRRFEEKAGQLYGMGFIGGFCHLYIGQEAVVVGVRVVVGLAVAVALGVTVQAAAISVCATAV